MQQVIIGIWAKLVKDGNKPIDLVVHRHRAESTSPCVVLKDGDRSGIGGSIQSVDQIFDLEVAKYPGYVVKDRMNLIQRPA